MEELQTQAPGAAVRFPPPFVPLIALVLGVGLQFVLPLPFPLDGLWRWVLGTLLATGGVALLLVAAGLFRKTGQDPKPWVTTPEIISTGVYAYTRNPMYVSMGMLTVGIGVILANSWVVLSVPLVWWTIYTIAIRHEEAYLEEKFGQVYTDYKSSVRRWL